MIKPIQLKKIKRKYKIFCPYCDKELLSQLSLTKDVKK